MASKYKTLTENYTELLYTNFSGINTMWSSFKNNTKRSRIMSDHVPTKQTKEIYSHLIDECTTEKQREKPKTLRTGG